MIEPLSPDERAGLMQTLGSFDTPGEPHSVIIIGALAKDDMAEDLRRYEATVKTFEDQLEATSANFTECLEALDRIRRPMGVPLQRQAKEAREVAAKVLDKFWKLS